GLDVGLGGDRHPVDADALGHQLQVRARVPTDTQPHVHEQRLDHPRGRALAVGARDVDHRIRALRIAEQVRQSGDPRQRRLDLGLGPTPVELGPHADQVATGLFLERGRVARLDVGRVIRQRTADEVLPLRMRGTELLLRRKLLVVGRHALSLTTCDDAVESTSPPIRCPGALQPQCPLSPAAAPTGSPRRAASAGRRVRPGRVRQEIGGERPGRRRHRPSSEVLEPARALGSPGPGTITYHRADVTAHPLPPRHYDIITCIASLHHLPFDTVTTLRDALAPHGVLAVLGLAKPSTPRDWAIWLGSLPFNHVAKAVVSVAERLNGGADPLPEAPVRDEGMSLNQIRREAARLLPGSRIRVLPFWRYLLVYRRV